MYIMICFDIIYHIIKFMEYKDVIEFIWIFRKINNLENLVLEEHFKKEMEKINTRYSNYVISINFKNEFYNIIDGYIDRKGFIHFNNLKKVNFMVFKNRKGYILKYNCNNLSYYQNKIVALLSKNQKISYF